MNAATVNDDLLRDREAKTAAALREIDAHLQRLQAAKQQREAALARIRSELALRPSDTDQDDD